MSVLRNQNHIRRRCIFLLHCQSDIDLSFLLPYPSWVFIRFLVLSILFTFHHMSDCYSKCTHGERLSLIRQYASLAEFISRPTHTQNVNCAERLLKRVQYPLNVPRSESFAWRKCALEVDNRQAQTTQRETTALRTDCATIHCRCIGRTGWLCRTTSTHTTNVCTAIFCTIAFSYNCRMYANHCRRRHRSHRRRRHRQLSHLLAKLFLIYVHILDVGFVCFHDL